MNILGKKNTFFSRTFLFLFMEDQLTSVKKKHPGTENSAARHEKHISLLLHLYKILKRSQYDDKCSRNFFFFAFTRNYKINTEGEETQHHFLLIAVGVAYRRH